MDPFDGDPDDELLPVTVPYVVETLGFDPRELEVDEDDDAEQTIPITQPDDDVLIAAIRKVFEDGAGRERDEAIRDVARLLGYTRTGSTILATLGSQMLAAVRRGIVSRDNGVYAIDCRSIGDYALDDQIKYLLAAMGHTWWDRDEAIAAAARYLGFQRTGKNIRAAFKSAINAAASWIATARTASAASERHQSTDVKPRRR